ncbi:MAG TPA: NADH-quinone oxidoreductase subunit NuoF [Gammaproteobacteria bacterium]|nr:NADH-quinone oxidoreductase subunit NuoF [Gammaproteobacteria bacterium]
MEPVLTRNIQPGREPLDLDGYEKAGGYQALRKALKELAPTDIIDMVKQSNLRGRGGGGFPTGIKWAAVPQGDKARPPSYLLVNADEMEPGTFKDRLLMEGDPHQCIEAFIISAYAIQAQAVFIFLRAAYHESARRLARALDEVRAKGYLGGNILGSGFSLDIALHRSAGRYICGEETSLINAMEGVRAIPRWKPPLPQVAGLWGQPTVVNNVETLCNVPHIVARGADWFNGISRAKGKDGGTKLYGASGRVKRPGLWELPMGITVRELFEGHAGGMQDGYQLRAFQPGGASTQFAGPEHLDVPMDFDSLGVAGTRLGTGTMIVLDDRTCPIGALANLEHFFAQESCGWCTPCREGLPWTERLLLAIENGNGRSEDVDILEMHTRFLSGKNTFCAHAPGAMMPLETGLKLFKDDFERHIREHGCSYRVSAELGTGG